MQQTIAQTKKPEKTPEKTKAAQKEIKKEAQKAVAKTLKGMSFQEGAQALSMKQPEGPGDPVTTTRTAPVNPLKDPKSQPDAKSEHVPNPKYANVKGQAFIKGEGDATDIAHTDVSQGQLGDCYFIASLAAIAKANPEAIRQRVKDNGDGTWTVTFAEGGDVVVDNQLPVDASGEPVYAGPGNRTKDGVELWVALIEKAWAKLKGGYEVIRGSKVKMTSKDAMAAITGKETSTIYPKNVSDDELIRLIAEADQKHWGMTLGAFTKDDVDQGTRDEAAKLDIHFNHAYAIIGVDEKAKEVTLYNPWGKEYKVPKLTPALIKKFYRVLHINKTT